MKYLTQICTKLQVSCCWLLGEPDTLFSLLEPEVQQGKGLLMAPACCIGGLGELLSNSKAHWLMGAGLVGGGTQGSFWRFVMLSAKPP